MAHETTVFKVPSNATHLEINGSTIHINNLIQNQQPDVKAVAKPYVHPYDVERYGLENQPSF